MDNNGSSAKGFEFRKFATPRIIGGIAIAVIVLWALSIIFGSLVKPTRPDVAEQTAHLPAAARALSDPAAQSTTAHPTPAASDPAHREHAGQAATAVTSAEHGRSPAAEATHAPAPQQDAGAQKTTASSAAKPAAGHDTSARGHATPADAHTPAAKPAAGDRHPLPETAAPVHKPTPKGVAFVEAAIQPLDHELEERWWGWRPNDIVNLTDNVNNFQLGVLEVTRRTIVALAERISRHGVTDALDPNLEEAMNWFMVKASSYWFPSAESKYKDGLDEMRKYLDRLRAGKATFYIRADNLIPLLASFEDLLGSCDENLVKEVNEDGTEVGSFSVDDYFYYTQGVASSMATVLEAVHQDFLLTLESRNATELLHHAIVACQRAAQIDPWIILDRDLSSVFANHRANMAAPISHARFYLGQLVKTLST